MRTHAEELEETLRRDWSPPSDLLVWRWFEAHVTLDNTGPMPGRYSSAFTPQVRWVTEAFRRPKTERVVMQLSAQSAKTQTLICLLLYLIAEDPGPAMWIGATAESAMEFARKRLFPAVADCPKTSGLLPQEKTRRGKKLIQFDSMNLMIRGANSRVGLQSDPVRYLFCDERREWKAGAIDLARKRQRTFYNSVEFSVGTAGCHGDDLDEDFRRGTQTHLHFRCLKCGHSQPFRFGRDASSYWPQPRGMGGLRWDEGARKESGKWDLAAVKRSTEYECEACGHRHANADKAALVKTYHAVDHNPNAPPGVYSFNWNALSMLWSSCAWGNIAVEFLEAVERAKLGDLEPLKAFVTETLGEPWQDSLGAITDATALETRKRTWKYGEAWPEERARFLAADRQSKGGEHYWYVVRAFGSSGASRLVSHGRCSTKVELLELAKQFGVPVANCMVDSGEGMTTQDTYRFCRATGWKAFKGDDQRFYLVNQQDPKGAPGKMVMVRRIWDKTSAQVFDLAGKNKVAVIPLFRFSSDSTKDALGQYIAGVIGDWQLPADLADEYVFQMTAEQRRERTDRRGRPVYEWVRVRPDNHLWDCEQMLLVAAIVSRAVMAPEVEKPKAA